MFSSVTFFLEASGRALAALLSWDALFPGLWSSHCPGTSYPITLGSRLLSPILGACFLVSIASFIWFIPSFWYSASSSSFLSNIIRHFIKLHRLNDQLDAEWRERGKNKKRPPRFWMKRLNGWVYKCWVGILGALSYLRCLRPAASRYLPEFQGRNQGQRPWICSCPSGHGC